MGLQNPIMDNPVMAWLLVIIMILFMIAIVVIELFYKERRKAFIGKWLGNVFTVIKVMNVNPFQKSLKIKVGNFETSIPFDFSKPTFKTKRKTYVYCIDIDDKSQTGFSKNDFKVQGDFYDIAFAKGSIKHMVSGMSKPQIAGYIMYIIIGIAIGLPTGILIQIIAKLGA
jgi:hypothetical protein